MMLDLTRRVVTARELRNVFRPVFALTCLCSNINTHLFSRGRTEEPYRLLVSPTEAMKGTSSARDHHKFASRCV